jgi:hypothetical protein
MAWIPLTTRGKVVGILNIGTTGQPIPFTPQDVELMRAIGNVDGPIADEIEGMDVLNQAAIDQTLIKLDGTPNKAALGGAEARSHRIRKRAVQAGCGKTRSHSRLGSGEGAMSVSRHLQRPIVRHCRCVFAEIVCRVGTVGCGRQPHDALPHPAAPAGHRDELGRQHKCRRSKGFPRGSERLANGGTIQAFYVHH